MSFLTYDTADHIISSLEIIEKLFFPETDFWHDNYLKLLIDFIENKTTKDWIRKSISKVELLQINKDLFPISKKY